MPQRQLFIGLFTEGTTDDRFLEPITQRLFNQILLNESFTTVDTEVFVISIDKKGLGFTEQVLAASKAGVEQFGIMLLCIHTDADSRDSKSIYQNKIIPAIDTLKQQKEHIYCKEVIAIIPIQEVEAWMLADKELLKTEIGTQMSDNQLGIHRTPESISDPKSVIEKAIRIAISNKQSRRRQKLSISDLYQPVGQQIDLTKLRALDSFMEFENQVRKQLVIMGFLKAR